VAEGSIYVMCVCVCVCVCVHRFMYIFLRVQLVISRSMLIGRISMGNVGDVYVCVLCCVCQYLCVRAYVPACACVLHLYVQ